MNEPIERRSALNRLSALRRYLAARWFTAVLLLACSVFAVNTIRDQLALREFDSHLAEITALGGGVLFVMSVADCSETADLTALVADELRADGIAVRGLVIADGVDFAALQDAMGAANERFPHVVVGGRGAAAFVGRAGTPVALGVAASGEVWVAERFGIEGVTGAVALTRRLRRAVTER